MTDGALLGADAWGATPERVWWWGRALMGLALIAGVGITVVLAAENPWFGLLVPAAGVATAVVVLLSRYPLGHLLGVLAFFSVTASYEEGVQVEEILFAAYYLAFLAHWFGTRLLIRRERVVQDATDGVVLAFLLYMTASLTQTILFGGNLSVARSEWINFSMLAFYFPVKEACARYRYGPWAIAAVLLLWGSYAFVQNVMLLKAAMSSAAYAWQVARGRVPMNEILLLAASLLSMTMAIHARRRPARLAFATAFAVFSLGLILTQWRAYYVDWALGLFLIFVLGTWAARTRMAGYGLAAGLAGAVLAYMVLGDAVALLALGIADRLLSITTATSADISLLNRWLETKAAWALITVNPIVGYGLGTEFGFYDAISKSTWVKPYVHNGYLMLWFKFGILGLGAVLFVWGRSIWSAFVLLRDRNAPGEFYPLALFAFVMLVSLLPSHATSATFTTGDTVLTFGVLTGIAAGLRERARGVALAATAEA